MTLVAAGMSKGPADLIIDRALVGSGPSTDRYLSIAVGGEHLIAVGSREELSGLVGESTARIDAGGRRLIPGLIDSHIHLVRAGLRWAIDTRWEGVGSVGDGLERLVEAAAQRPRGAWVVVLGGWHPGQFKERRPPSLAELDEAVPGHPIYIQRNYQEAFLNSAGMQAVGLGDPATGRVTGPPALQTCLATIDQPTPDQQVEGTRHLLAEFSGLGLTGAIDAAGFGMTSAMYEPLLHLWRGGELTLRLRLLLGASQPRRETTDIRSWLEEAQPGFGDNWLRYLGFGEVLLFPAHDGEGVVDVDLRGETAELRQLSQQIFAAGWPMHVHAILDTSVTMVLDAWAPLIGESNADHRLTITHADQISDENLRRVRDLGVGLTVQHGMAYRGLDSVPTWGLSRVASSPPLGQMLAMSVPVGAGTDATVVAHHSPWRCLYWLITGRSVDGGPERAEEHRLSRQQALSLYTSGSAWFSFEDHQRGTLAPGYLADLAILSDDYFMVSDESIPDIRSELTMVGGKVVHRSARFAPR